jgi:hypothetical protein
MDVIFAGSQQLPVIGYGNVKLRLTSTTRTKPQYLQLRDVVYCKSFACNVVSLRQLERHGIWWDMSPGN